MTKVASAERAAAHCWLLTLAAVFLLPYGMSIGATPLDPTELMGLLSQIEKSSVNFEETKHLAALTAPIVRRGTMRYVRPERLEMQVDKPYFERLEIVGDRLTIENRDGKRQIDLASQPLAGVLVEGLRAVLAGDLPGLGRRYRYRFEGEIGAWRLELEPLDKGAAGLVHRIDIEGSKAQLSRIAIEEVQGDRTSFVLSAASGPTQ
jgi:hypothetical protein